MRLGLFRPHARLRSQVDAYLDGELAASEAPRFESHLAGCAACSAAVARGRELKVLLASAPAVQAPRSFRLTPEMLGEPARAPSPARPRQFAVRFAQASAGLAAAALVAVAVVDLTGGDSPANRETMLASGATESSAKDASQLQPAAGGGFTGAATPAARGGAASPPALPTPIGGRANAQAIPSGTATSQPPERALSGSGATPQAGTAGAFNSYAASPEADGAEKGASSGRDEGGGVSGVRMAEYVLAGIAIFAILTWLGLAQQSRSR